VESHCPDYPKYQQWLKDHGAELSLFSWQVGGSSQKANCPQTMNIETKGIKTMNSTAMILCQFGSSECENCGAPCGYWDYKCKKCGAKL